jgi:hypothetical protein
MPAGGQLVVHTTSSGNVVELHLIDTGCGMDNKPPRRFSTRSYDQPGGSGWVATAGKIVDAHGGDHDSKRVGRHQVHDQLAVPARLTAEAGK